LSGLLILLTMSLLLVMPVTEHLCNWDHFLRGGPDVEFSLLAWLLFTAIIVLSMHGSMLRPVFSGAIAARDCDAASGALGRSGHSPSSASMPWCIQSADERGAAQSSRAAMPMRI
jgi:hypothetical protein